MLLFHVNVKYWINKDMFKNCVCLCNLKIKKNPTFIIFSAIIWFIMMGISFQMAQNSSYIYSE